MSRVAIAGATGVVGSRALEQLLAWPELHRVVAVGRRAVPQDHPACADARFANRLATMFATVACDMQNESAIAEAIGGPCDVGVCALGTTLKQAGSRQAFEAVDLHAVVAFAKACRARGVESFVLVSSLGASAKSATFYLRIKGQAEQAVCQLGFKSVAILRPSIIDDEGARTDRRPGEKIALVVGRAVFALAGRTRRYAPISANTIGRAAAQLAFRPQAGCTIVQSEMIHAYASPKELS